MPVTKSSDSQIYKYAKRALWGDLWPFQPWQGVKDKTKKRKRKGKESEDSGKPPAADSMPQ
jgi:ribosomal protein RSM22 (predicted rRNA methylase)